MTNRESSITAQSDLRTAVLWLNGSAGPGTELVGEDLRAAALIIRDIRQELEQSLPAPAGAPRSATAPRARAAAVGRASGASGGVVPSQRHGDYEVVEIDCDEDGAPLPKRSGNGRAFIGLRVRNEDGVSGWSKVFGDDEVAACVEAFEQRTAIAGVLRRSSKGYDFLPGSRGAI